MISLQRSMVEPNQANCKILRSNNTRQCKTKMLTKNHKKYLKAIVCGEDVVVRQREKSFKDDHSH